MVGQRELLCGDESWHGPCTDTAPKVLGHLLPYADLGGWPAMAKPALRIGAC
jgi:hypothetical protein